MVELRESIKVVFIGDTKSGKTHLITSYLQGYLSAEHKPTLFENYCKEISYKKIRYRVFICDTGGNSDFKRLRQMSYLNCDVFVLCVSYESPDNLKDAAKILAELKGTSAPVLLCMTKSDICRSVTQAEIANFATQNGLESVYECSANDRQTVKNLFKGVVKTHVDGAQASKRYYYGSCGSCC
ncbi:Ras-like protein gene family, member U [Pancytospora philotis]|nr:Ras-like protein gene family, member U [Pancytospora philotis]